MNERPILFRGDMVRAILEGRKTQTRRIIKLPTKKLCSADCKGPDGRIVIDPGGTDVFGPGPYVKVMCKDDAMAPRIRCPYGYAGASLWVRETWTKWAYRYAYRADCTEDDSGERDGWWNGDAFMGEIEWRPSIFMPREACRIKLEIKTVRTERLDDISDADAFSEGLRYTIAHDIKVESPPFRQQFQKFFRDFRKLKPQDNPLLWVLEFKRVQ